MNNPVNEYNLSAPINFSWSGDTTTKTLGVTFGYGSGDPAKYAHVTGAAPYVDSGDEFSRYNQASLTLGISRKWSDRFKTSFDLTGSTTNSSGYQGLPSGTSGPPSYTYDRPYSSVSFIFEI
jgi:hypothetical protein